MRKRKVIIEELQPGIMRYRPEHRQGVITAVCGFVAEHRKGKRRKRALVGRAEPRKRSTANPRAFYRSDLFRLK